MSAILESIEPWIAKAVFATVTFDPEHPNENTDATVSAPKIDRTSKLAQVMSPPKIVGDAIHNICHLNVSDGTHSISLYVKKTLNELNLAKGSLVRIRSRHWTISHACFIRQYPEAESGQGFYHSLPFFEQRPFCIVLFDQPLSCNPEHALVDDNSNVNDNTNTNSSVGIIEETAHQCIESLGCEGMGIVGSPIDVHSAIDVRRALKAIPTTKYRIQQITNCFNFTLNNYPKSRLENMTPAPDPIGVGCFEDEYPNKRTVNLLVDISSTFDKSFGIQADADADATHGHDHDPGSPDPFPSQRMLDDSSTPYPKTVDRRITENITSNRQTPSPHPISSITAMLGADSDSSDDEGIGANDNNDNNDDDNDSVDDDLDDSPAHWDGTEVKNQDILNTIDVLCADIKNENVKDVLNCIESHFQNKLNKDQIELVKKHYENHYGGAGSGSPISSVAEGGDENDDPESLVETQPLHKADSSAKKQIQKNAKEKLPDRRADQIRQGESAESQSQPDSAPLDTQPRNAIEEDQSSTSMDIDSSPDDLQPLHKSDTSTKKQIQNNVKEKVPEGGANQIRHGESTESQSEPDSTPLDTQPLCLSIVRKPNATEEDQSPTPMDIDSSPDDLQLETQPMHTFGIGNIGKPVQEEKADQERSKKVVEQDQPLNEEHSQESISEGGDKDENNGPSFELGDEDANSAEPLEVTRGMATNHPSVEANRIEEQQSRQQVSSPKPTTNAADHVEIQNPPAVDQLKSSVPKSAAKESEKIAYMKLPKAVEPTRPSFSLSSFATIDEKKKSTRPSFSLSSFATIDEKKKSPKKGKGRKKDGKKVPKKKKKTVKKKPIVWDITASFRNFS